MNQKLTRLISSLEYLADCKVRNKMELGDWYKKARELEKEVTSLGGLSSFMPHFFWHYLADADIRFKDNELSEFQNTQIRELIGQLKEKLRDSRKLAEEN